ncbi:MAG: DUF4270 domain-containing protein [Bacteroidota bacterium]|nr:DUF4270 domain-containing protein [Bacteroidota bacterium]
MKNVFLTCLCGLGFLSMLFSCSDDNLIGESLQPGQDKISLFYDTVHVQSKTVKVDSILYRSSTAYLGEFTDPHFGTSKCDFMAQLYCPYNFTFPDDVKHIDSAYLYLYYTKWFGDSTALMHVKVYELNNPLTVGQSYYTNLNTASYCDKTKLLGQVAFTTGDMYSSDSVRALSTYYTVVKVPLKLSLGNRFLSDYLTNPSDFATPGNFRNFFNGIYVSCDFGNGAIAYVTHSELELSYGTTLYSSTMSGLRDSFVIKSSYFPVTKEVKQVNRFSHPDLSKYLNPDDAADSLNYIYSPAGLFTRVTIPSSVFTTLSGKSVNSMKLRVNAAQLDNSTYGMAPPTKMLLIRESDALTFFSRFEMNDDENSFLATYDDDNECYDFDLSKYGQKMVRNLDKTASSDETFTPFTTMLMIPVTVITSDDGDQVRIEQLLSPSAVKVRAWNHPDQPMKLELVYSKGKLN